MATNRSLRAIREQTLFAYAENIIDADSYCYMMPINQNLFIHIGNTVLLMLE